jgi:hypothetical protein
MKGDSMDEAFDTWGILEIMGHQTYAGKLSEQTIGGAAFVRVDVPQVGDIPPFTKLFGGGSIYGITPTTEEVARLRAESLRQSPMSVYDLPEKVRQAMRAAAQPTLAPVVSDDLDDFDNDTE